MLIPATYRALLPSAVLGVGNWFHTPKKTHGAATGLLRNTLHFSSLCKSISNAAVISAVLFLEQMAVMPLARHLQGSVI